MHETRKASDLITDTNQLAQPKIHFGDNLRHVMRKPTFWFPTWSDTNQAIQLQKMARGLKFGI